MVMPPFCSTYLYNCFVIPGYDTRVQTKCDLGLITLVLVAGIKIVVDAEHQGVWLGCPASSLFTVSAFGGLAHITRAALAHVH